MNLQTEIDPEKSFSEEESAPPVQESKPVQPERQAAKEIATTDKGLLIGSSIEEQWRIAKAYSESGLMPVALNSPQKVLVAMQLCRELNLPTITSIGKIMVLNGTPSIFGDLPLALVLRSPQYENVKESWIKNEKGETIGARCEALRKGATEPVIREFTVELAKIAGLWNKKSSSGKPTPWVLYPDRMLQMRARSWALKDAFADVLGGVSILEYDHNAIVVNGRLIADEEEALDVAAEINREYGHDTKSLPSVREATSGSGSHQNQGVRRDDGRDESDAAVSGASQ